MPQYLVTFENCSSAGHCEEFCTGTIVEDTWILTAGHCNVLPGHIARLHAQGSPSSWSLEVAEVKLPPGITYYECAIRKNCMVNGLRMDIALVRLKEPIPLGGQFHKALITNSIFPTEGLKGWVAGGGTHDGRPNRPGTLKWADAEVDKYFVATNTMLPSVWANQGDSGGPFMRWVNGNSLSGKMEIVGVCSAVFTQPYMTFVGNPLLKTWILTTIAKPFW